MVNINLTETKRQNLIRLMTERKLRPIDLAELIGRDAPYISAILKPGGEKGSRSIGPKILKIICEKLQIDDSEFYVGVDFFNAKELPLHHKKSIPVISWVNAGLFAEPVDLWPVGISGEGDFVFSYHKTGDHSFGLKVHGDSMAPRYLPGDTIIVDPEARCDNGCPCIVYLNGKVTFKIFTETENEIRLSPLNDKHEERVIKKAGKADFRIIGKVVDMIPKL